MTDTQQSSHRLSGRTVIVVIALLVLGYFFLSRESEEERLRALFSEAETTVSLLPALSPIEQLGEVRKLGAHLADRISATLDHDDEERTYSVERAQLEQQALGVLRTLSSLEASVKALTISVDGENATAAFEVHILGAMKGADGQFYEHWELEVLFHKTDDRWRVSTVHGSNLRD